MKLANVEVKSGGTVVGTADVEEFESVTEAIDFFQAQEAKAAAEENREVVPTVGTDSVLELLNAQYKARVTNTVRVQNTRGVNPITALKANVKTNPKLKASLAALLAEYGLPSKLE